MTIKSFDEYFKEKGYKAFSKTLDENVYVNERDLENAKIVFEEFRTPKGIITWHSNHYQGSEEEQKEVKEFDNKHLKGILFGDNLSRIEDAAYEYASYYEKEKQNQEKQAGFSEIKREYNTIRNAENLSKKRIETIMGNTAYIDYEMVRKDQKDTNERIENLKEKIEKKYKKINPELASLREEEKNKIENGMDPKQAKRERREAVKAYYNKKSQREG